MNAAKNITVYTTSSCAYCVMVKKWLSAKGRMFQEVNLDDAPNERQRLYQMSGQLTVPVTVVSDASGRQDITVGWNPAKLAAALAD
ncbi:MAG: glutaredoxin family protein [Candidatus Chaera renei]|uniref:Glutaredoxin family protein n=1 Tax=Candidatus Chaera renei TaxID=2506947 RepID=A0A4Q0AK68_9BACT|nr:MAG: glutaredoxin family protein [Candidatus Chaera renei]